MATTVLPVPGPPRTRAGPLNYWVTSFSWLGWRKHRHFARGALSIAVRSSCDLTVTNRRFVSAFSSAARDPWGLLSLGG